MYLLVAKQLVIMSLLSVVSFAFSKKFKYGRHESEYLSKLLLFVISPCMIFNTFNIPFTQEKLSVMGLSLLLGFITLSFMIAVSLIAVRSKTDLGKSRVWTKWPLLFQMQDLSAYRWLTVFLDLKAFFRWWAMFQFLIYFCGPSAFTW